jgi:hypothetical protein
MTFCQFEIANPETVFVWVGKWIARVDPNKERVGGYTTLPESTSSGVPWNLAQHKLCRVEVPPPA